MSFAALCTLLRYVHEPFHLFPNDLSVYARCIIDRYEDKEIAAFGRDMSAVFFFLSWQIVVLHGIAILDDMLEISPVIFC